MSLFNPEMFFQNRSTVWIDSIDLIDQNCILGQYSRRTVQIDSFKSKYLLMVPVDSFDTISNTNSNVSINSNDSQGIFEKYMVSINSYKSRSLPTMNTIPTVCVNSSHPTSMSENNSISPSMKSGSLFDDTLLFLGRVMYIVLGFVMLTVSSCIPYFQGFGVAPYMVNKDPLVHTDLCVYYDSTHYFYLKFTIMVFFCQVFGLQRTQVCFLIHMDEVNFQ